MSEHLWVTSRHVSGTAVVLRAASAHPVELGERFLLLAAVSPSAL